MPLISRISLHFVAFAAIFFIVVDAVRFNGRKGASVVPGDDLNNEFVESAPFLAAFEKDGFAKDVPIKQYHDNGSIRVDGVGDFYLHTNSILMNDKAHHLLGIRPSMSEGETGVAIAIDELYTDSWNEGGIVVGTHDGEWLGEFAHATSLLREGLEQEEHKSGVVMAHRILHKKLLVDNSGRREVVLQLEPAHPFDAFRKMDIKVNSQRVLHRARKSSTTEELGTHEESASKNLRTRAVDSTTGGGTPVAISQCTPTMCESCTEYSDDDDCELFEDGSETYAWCWSTSDAEACIEYEKTISLLNLNYDIAKQEAVDKDLAITGVTGFSCKNCYAYLGGGVGVEIHYDYDLVGDDLWELSAHIWGASAMNLDLKIQDPVITGAIDTGELTIIPSGGISTTLFAIAGKVSVDLKPELRTRVRADGAVELKGKFTASSKLDANFVFGLEETDPYVFSDTTFDFDEPVVKFEKFSLVSATANEWSIDLFAEGDVIATVGSDSFGIDVLNELGVTDKLAFETTFASSRRRMRADELKAVDDRGHIESKQVIVHPGSRVEIPLAAFVPVATSDGVGQRETKFLDVHLRNDMCLGKAVSVKLKTALIHVPLEDGVETLEVVVPRERTFARCFGGKGQNSYYIEVETLSGKVVFVSHLFAISPHPDDDAQDTWVGATTTSTVDSMIINLTWDRGALAAPGIQRKAQYQIFDMLTPESIRVMAVPFGTEYEASRALYYDSHTMFPLALTELTKPIDNSGALRLALPVAPAAWMHERGEYFIRLFLTAATSTKVSIPVPVLIHVDESGNTNWVYAAVDTVRTGKFGQVESRTRLEIRATRQVRSLAQDGGPDRRRLGDDATCVTPTTRSEGFGVYKSTTANLMNQDFTVHTASSTDPYTVDLSSPSVKSASCTNVEDDDGDDYGNLVATSPSSKC